MAIGKKAAPQKKAVSIRFGDMSQGLLDDFSGEITGSEFRVHQYKEGSDAVLVYALTVTTDEGSEHTEYYSLGKTALDNFRPSPDGSNPVDDDAELEDARGPFIVPISDRARLSGQTAFGIFMREAGREEFGLEIGSDARDLLGTYAHFNRLEQPPIKRSGVVVQEEGKQPQGPWKVLCITDIPKREKAAAKPAAGKGKPAPKAAAKEEEEEDDNVLANALAEAVTEALNSSKTKTLTKVKIANIAMKLSDDKAEKKALVDLAGNPEFLGSIEGASYDDDEGVLSLDE